MTNLKNNSTLIPTNVNAVKAVKRLTSLMIKKQKHLNSRQLKQTEKFLNTAKSSSMYLFLTSRPFVIACKLIDPVAANRSVFFNKLALSPNDILRIDGNTDCQILIKNFGESLIGVAKLLSSAQTYLMAFDSEVSYLRALKLIITFEEEHNAPMCSLVATKEFSLWLNMQSTDARTSAAREFYKKWDSKESILIELTGILAAPSIGVTFLLQHELLAGSVLALPQSR